MNTEVRGGRFSKVSRGSIILAMMLAAVIIALLVILFDLNSAHEHESALAAEVESYQSQLSEAEQSERTHMAQIDRLESQVETLQTSLASFQGMILVDPTPEAAMLAEFQRKGLKDPINDIVADLMQHSELIP